MVLKILRCPPSGGSTRPVSESDTSLIERGTHNLDIEGSSGPSTPTITASSTSSSSGTAAGSTRSNSISVPDSGGSASGANTPSSKNLNTEGLPEGWTMQVAPNGRVFFINHVDKKTTWVDPRSGRPSPLPQQSNVPNRRHEDDLGPLPEGWEERVHTDGRIFFIDHNTRATQWEDPLVLKPKVAGEVMRYNNCLKEKYKLFQRRLKTRQGYDRKKCEIKIRRCNIFEDSYRQIANTSSLKLKLRPWVIFDNEVGYDYGGLAREWFYLLSKRMFDPYYGLFEYSASDNYTLQINPHSDQCNENHLQYFKFVGLVAGMAVFHGHILEGSFIKPFYKMMLQNGKVIELKDMESVDTEYYNSLQWIKENDPAELDLEFQVEDEQFGTIVSKELKPGGAKISVTNENKDEYIRLVVHWRFVSRIQQQMHSFP